MSRLQQLWRLRVLFKVPDSLELHQVQSLRAKLHRLASEADDCETQLDSWRLINEAIAESSNLDLLKRIEREWLAELTAAGAAIEGD